LIILSATACLRGQAPGPESVSDRPTELEASDNSCGLQTIGTDTAGSVRIAASGTLINAKIQKVASTGATRKAIATTNRDVRNRRGQVVIPAGSTAELSIQDVEAPAARNHSRVMPVVRALSMNIRGRTCAVTAKVRLERQATIPPGTPIVIALEYPLVVATR